VPSSMYQVRSFHALESFYGRFMKNFSSIIAPMTKIFKAKRFEWNEQAQTAFEEIKHEFISARILPFQAFQGV